MGVVITDGIGVSVRTGALIMADGIASYGGDGKPFAQPAAAADLSTAQWSPWGDNNLLPLEMADHIKNCGVLSAALDAKPRMAIGKGIEPYLLMNRDSDGKEELEWVSDPEIHDWQETNNTFDTGLDMIYDDSSYGWDAGSFILNGKRNYINRVRRIDVYKTRLQKMNSAANINSIFVCNDWKNATGSFNSDTMVQIPALKQGYELQDLMDRKRGFEFAFINRRLRNGDNYYPMPLWWAARAWVKVARSVPAFKNAMFTNQIQLKYIINISAKYWPNAFTDWDDMDEAVQRKAIQDKYDEIEKWLTGEDKAYKTLIGGSFFDEVKGVEIPFIKVDVIDDKVKDGKLLPESSAANSEILFALMMNPALMGAGQPGGPYSNNAGGSNVRESFLVQIMISEAERRLNTKVFNVIKRFNGWDKKHQVERKFFATTVSGNTTTQSEKKMTPILVWRYPTGILTTLDTGGSTKHEAA